MTFLNLPFWDFFSKHNIGYGEFQEIDYWVMVIISFLALCLVAIIVFATYSLIYDYIDKKKAITETYQGILIDKKYVGEYNSTSTGTTIMPNSNGGIGIGVTSSSSYSPERFLFFVKKDEVYKIEVDMDQYYEKNIGDQVRFEMIIGGLSKKVLEINLA